MVVPEWASDLFKSKNAERPADQERIPEFSVPTKHASDPQLHLDEILPPATMPDEVFASVPAHDSAVEVEIAEPSYLPAAEPAVASVEPEVGETAPSEGSPPFQAAEAQTQGAVAEGDGTLEGLLSELGDEDTNVASVDALDAAAELPTESQETSTQPVAVAPEDTRIEQVAESISAMDTKLDQIIKGNDWGRMSLVRLQDEIDGYRTDFLASAQLPLLKRVASLVASIEKVAKSDSIGPTDMDFLIVQLMEMLADQGVEPIEDPVGAKFTGSRHRGVQAVGTPDESLAGTIAECVTRGWIANGKVVTSQGVSVYKYEAPVDAEECAGNESGVVTATDDVGAMPEAGFSDASVVMLDVELAAANEADDAVQDQGGTHE